MNTAMLLTRGPGAQDNWDLRINVSVLNYNTTVSSSTGVTPHYTMFGYEATLPVEWVFPTPSELEETCWKRGNVLIRVYDVQGRRVWQNAQMYKPLIQNIPVGCLAWYFDPRIIPGTSHKLILFWAEQNQVSKLIAPALAEIKPVYYPGEEKLAILDVLKLYPGEDVIRQNPEDIDPDQG